MSTQLQALPRRPERGEGCLFSAQFSNFVCHRLVCPLQLDGSLFECKDDHVNLHLKKTKTVFLCSLELNRKYIQTKSASEGYVKN